MILSPPSIAHDCEAARQTHSLSAYRCSDFRRSTSIRTALLGMIFMTAWPAVASQRAAFIAQHRCPVVSALNEIHRRGPVQTSHNRFLSLTIRDHVQRYVQCIFIDRDTSMYCEAASGAYYDERSAPYRYVPTAERKEAMLRLGYRQESPTENFSRTVALGSPPDVGLAADLMLGALYDAFDARSGTIIDMDAPNGGTPFLDCGAPAM